MSDYSEENEGKCEGKDEESAVLDVVDSWQERHHAVETLSEPLGELLVCRMERFITCAGNYHLLPLQPCTDDA